MTIPIPFEYLDQLYWEIGLLFVISVALSIWVLCLLLILHKKKKNIMQYHTQLQQYEFQRQQIISQLQQYEVQRQQFIIQLQKYENQQKSDASKLHQYENQIQRDKLLRQDRALQKKQQETNRIAIEESLTQTPSKFYFPKPSCMNSSESRMFFYINNALDDFFPNKDDRKLYFVFPQVCLYAFIGVHKLPNFHYDIASRNYWAKSIDYVICMDNIQPCQFEPDRSKGYTYHAYTPILLIELDGQSHFSSEAYGTNDFVRQKKNDAFKNALFEGLNIPFIRYPLESGKIRAYDANGIKEEIRTKLGL